MEKLNKLVDFAKKIIQIIAEQPPKTAEKKLVNMCNEMFAIKCPSKLDGAIIMEYFKVFANMLIFKLGTAFSIFLVFNKVIKVIEMKCETIILLIPINGVKINKEINNEMEPNK